MIQKGDKKIIQAWTFYDWANSSYPLVITTAIFPIFYENATRSELGNKALLFGRQYDSGSLYSYVMAVSFLLVSIASPFLSGIADYSGNKKRFLQFFCYLGSLSCGSLYFFDVHNLAPGMLSVLLASVGYWGSMVFYNAYLPEIAEPGDHDRISAKGFSLGYFGSAVLLVMNLLMIMNPGWFGTTKETMTRISFITVALWWAGFAQITFARLPNNVYDHHPTGNVIFKGFRELLSVWKQLGELPRLKRFLSSFFLYSMGVQTVLVMAVLFAKQEVQGLEDSDLIASILIIQFLGAAGAFLFSRISSRLGNIKTLGMIIFIWMGICTGTYFFVFKPFDFYIVAATVGLVMGGIQSLSRSTYSKLLPETEDHASFFSFYDVTEKIGLSIGLMSFGYIAEISGGMRNSVLALILFFIVGFLVLLTIPKSKHVA